MLNSNFFRSRNTIALLIVVLVSSIIFLTSYMVQNGQFTFLNRASGTAIAPAQCLIYGYHDISSADSQLITVDPISKATKTLGPRYDNYDLEGLDIEPGTNIIWAAGGASGRIYKVDGVTGVITLIGSSGFSDLNAIVFKPTDGTLWGWVQGKGLIQIDKTTGKGTLAFSSSKDIEGLAWTNDGKLLYGSAGTSLHVYNASTKALTLVASNLPPDQVEGLQVRPDGTLMGSVHHPDNTGMSIFIYNPVTKTMLRTENISTPYNDLDAITYKLGCGEVFPSVTPTKTPTKTPTPSVILTPTKSPTPKPSATLTPTKTPTPTGPQVCEDLDADIVLVLDRSSSMNSKEADGRTKLEWAKEAAANLVDRISNTDGVTARISIVSFGAQGNDGTGAKDSKYNSTLHIGLTSNYANVKTAVTNVKYIESGTCIECGLRIANEQLSKSQSNNKVVILLSDGRANHNWGGTSTDAKQKAIATANAGRAEEYTYYVLGYGGDADTTTLKAIAGSDTRYRYKPDAKDWPEAFLSILDQICQEITPTPTNTPTNTPTKSPTPTNTPTPTDKPTDTPTKTPTPTNPMCEIPVVENVRITCPVCQ